MCGGEVGVRKMCGEVQKNMCVMEKLLAFLIGTQVIASFVQTQDKKCMCLLVREIKQMFKDLPMKVNAYEKRKFGRSGVANREVHA